LHYLVMKIYHLLGLVHMLTYLYNVRLCIGLENREKMSSDVDPPKKVEQTPSILLENSYDQIISISNINHTQQLYNLPYISV